MEREAIFNRITAKDVGFDLGEEAKNLVRDLGESPLHKKEILENAARQIRTYESETLEDNVVSYYPCFVHSFNGKTKLFSADVPNERFLIEKQIDPLERDGMVNVGFNLLQKKIGETSGNKFFLWVSPKGPAGIRGIFKDINYRYHQVYIGEIKDNKTEAYALKSDVDEDVLVDWIKSVSNGSVNIWEKTPAEFLQSPVVLQTVPGDQALETAFYKLEETLEKKGQKRFYKGIDIYSVPQLIKEERAKQQRDVEKIADALKRRLLAGASTDKYLGVEEARRAIGGQLYVLYDRYANERGEVTLTGCAGGQITIKSLFSIDAQLPTLENILNIFSSKYRIESGIGQQEWFKCPNCEYKADGPVGNKCPGCNLTKEDYAEAGNKVC